MGDGDLERTDRVEVALDRLHRAARAIPALRRLAIISRISLAVAFIPTGMVKVLGRRFILTSPETPIGYFFEAMYQSGFFWNVIGWGQVIAGVLLLVPRTATLGAVVSFPIAASLFLITVSLEFRGTPYVTGGMLLAATFLLCWDYHRWRPILWPDALPEHDVPAEVGRIGRLEWAGYAMGTVCGFGVFLAVRSILVPRAFVPTLLVGGLFAAGIVIVAWIRSALGYSRSDRAEPSIRRE